MILNHILRLYTHQKEECHANERNNENLIYSIIHILVVALIPTICSYYASAYVGWTIGVGEPIKLNQGSAQLMAIFLYLALIFGVLILTYLILWMAKIFNSRASLIQSLELAAYASTPMLMVGIAALYPVLWFATLAGLAAICYSIYLLYSGVPIMMNIPEDKSFIYSSAVVTCGLVILTSLIALSAVMWSMGFGADYISTY